MAGATLIDGFFMPAFAAKYGVLAAIQVLTKFALFAFSGAAVLWGIDLLERPCAARITGALACAAALAEFAIVAASGTLTPRNLAVIILVQAVWCIPFASRLWNPQARL